MLDVRITHAEWLITVDSDRRLITDAAVGIKNGQFVHIGKSDEAESWGQARTEIDATGKIVTPGFIDCHIHTTFQMSRGLADNAPYREFLFDRMYPFESSLDAETAEIGIRLCVFELLRNGVTTFIDAGNYYPHITARVAGEVGVRCIVARSSFDVQRSSLGEIPNTFVETTTEAIDKAEECVKTLDGTYDGRVRAWFQFRGMNNATDEMIVRLKSLADMYGVGVQTHACFAKGTVESSIRQHGMSEISRLATLECLGPNVLLVHVGWTEPNELTLLADHDVKCVVAPSSTMHNGYGNIAVGHVPELLQMGVTIGLGSDHASSGIVDIAQEMLLVSCGYKEIRKDPRIMPVEMVIEMATINGARCALWNTEIGSIEIGKKADLVMFDARTPEWQPLYNPLSNLVYSATGKSVDTVIVDGKILLRDGHAVTFSETSVLEEVRRVTKRVLRESGLSKYAVPNWPCW